MSCDDHLDCKHHMFNRCPGCGCEMYAPAVWKFSHGEGSCNCGFVVTPIHHRVAAPFTMEQAAALNTWQALGFVHEFTCGNDHPDSVHLIATLDGWICPLSCGYTQDWAHWFMANTTYHPKEPSL